MGNARHMRKIQNQAFLCERFSDCTTQIVIGTVEETDILIYEDAHRRRGLMWQLERRSLAAVDMATAAS